MKYSLVIPAYNEEKRIGLTLNAYATYIITNGYDKNVEVLIIANNCTDNTVKIVSEFKKKFEFIKLIEIPYYTGKGGAVLAGFKEARGDIIAFVDSDNASTAEETFKIMTELENNQSLTATIASRYLEDSVINSPSNPFRFITSRLYNIFVRILFNIQFKDTQCGLKAFKSETAKRLAKEVTTSGWTFDIDILVNMKSHNEKVKEIATIWTDISNSKLSVSQMAIPVLFELLSIKLKYQTILLKLFKAR